MVANMDAWHRDVAAELLAPALSGHGVDQEAELEIEFGGARSAIAYVLELARAHRLAGNGQVAGDDVWLQLGHGRIRFTLNRRESNVILRGLHTEARYRWDSSRRTLVDRSGASVDLVQVARAAIGELVTTLQKHPSQRLSTAPPPELEDEPTKG